MLNFLSRLFNNKTAAEGYSFTYDDIRVDTVDEPLMAHTVGDVLKLLGLRVIHFRPIPDEADPFGLSSARATTVVYKPRQDENHTIEVSTAVCSAKDTYNRKLGTQLALQRFMSGKTIKLPPNKLKQSDFALLQGFFG